MNDIRERMQETARYVATILPPGTGFILFAFDFGPNVRLEYTSNASREDVIKLLKAFIEKADSGGWMKHLKDDPQ